MPRRQPDEGDAQGVAIVGTRQASDEGMRSAYDLAGVLAKAGVPVASGLAAGIPTGALNGALSAGGRTVAVIGTGLRHSYPRANAGLQARTGKVGMVISQFLPDTPPNQDHVPDAERGHERVHRRYRGGRGSLQERREDAGPSRAGIRPACIPA